MEIKSPITNAPIYYNRHLNPIDIYGEEGNVDGWLDDCIEDVLPLLKDIWLEIEPKNRYTTKSAQLYCTDLNEENKKVLNCIINILSYFYELTLLKRSEDQEERPQNKTFTNKSREIIVLLFQTFPFSNGTVQNGPDTKCIEENLTLCYLFLALFEEAYKKELVVQSLSYLNVCLLNRNYVGQEKTILLLKVLKQFYTSNLKRWVKYRTTDLAQFVKNTAKYYVNDTKQVDSIEVFNLLHEEIDLIGTHFSSVVQKACKSLVCSKIDRRTFVTIRSLVLRQLEEVQSVLSVMLPEVLDNIKTVEIEGIENRRLKANALIGLYKYVPLTEKNCKSLWEFVEYNPDLNDLVWDVTVSCISK